METVNILELTNIYKTEPIDQAISFYKDRLRGKDLYPVNIDAILKEKLSSSSTKTRSSWAMVSILNTSEAYKLQIRRCHPFKFFHTTLSHARDIIFPCLKLSAVSDHSLQEQPFGFLFLYGLHGEGERVGELMKSFGWDMECS
uniref:Putative Acyl-CoA N-acyltransferases superfamily protein n=1 Tax=Davidia involucrata TaxID=16924 RepID=A0A5B7BVD2_DAVIN